MTTVQQQQYPALRVDNQPDGLDATRTTFVRERWASQDGLLLPYGRMVEEHCRMLAGRHWDIWSDALGKFIDVTTLFTDREKLWRERPVINLLTYWFMLTHARMTENPPIVTFQPATADRMDAMLAQTMDTVYKTLWQQLEMPDVIGRMIAWLIAGGTAYVKTYPDYRKAQPTPRVGPASFTVPHPETGEPVEMDADGNVPYDAMGNAQADLEYTDSGDIEVVPNAEPEDDLTNPDLGACALNPLQVRAEWNAKPFREKAWVIHRDYYSPEFVKKQWGVDVTPDVSPTGGAEGPGYLERLLFDSGHYGAVYTGGAATVGNAAFGVGSAPADNYVCVDEYWEVPLPENDNQGRLLVVTKDTVLYDGPRPFPDLPSAAPIEQFQFVEIPGRPAGTTPLEFLTPLQRAYNRGWAQALEHRSLMTNPMILVDETATIDEAQFEAVPGSFIRDGARNGQPLIQAFAPPNLTGDFWKVQDMIYQTFLFLGNVTGTEGSAPTDNASGELVTQLRANSDRFIGPTMRGVVISISRMAETWSAMLKVLWTEPKLIIYAGEDSVPQTLAIEPDIWQGAVHAVPDVESMLPEGRGEKQAKVFQLWQAGWFGPPMEPQTIAKVSPMMRFPNMNRAALPGGVDAITANHNLGKLLLGAPPDEIPLFDAYKIDAHLDVVQNYIAASEFTQNDESVQQAVLGYVDRLKQFAIQQAARKAQEQAMLQLTVAQAAAGILPPPQPMEGGDPNAPAPNAGGARSTAHVQPDSRPVTPRPAGSGAFPPQAPARTRAPFLA